MTQATIAITKSSDNLAEGIHPNPIVIDKLMRQIQFFFRHFSSKIFNGNRGIGVPPDIAQPVPEVGPYRVGLSHAEAKLVIPPYAGLGSGMAFHCTAQIPFERPDVVLFDPEAERVDHADQFFGIGIAGTRQRLERFMRGGKVLFDHEVAGVAERVGLRGKRQEKADCQHAGRTRSLAVLIGHLVLPSLIAMPAAADAIDPEDFLPFDAAQAKIGQLLFYDKILSGNRNISCGTCHHHSLGSTDGLSLGIGEGGVGLGADRTPGTGRDRIHKRIPRNAPALWNLAHREIQTVFHDGRLQKIDDDEYEFDSPAGSNIPMGLNSIIAAQALFPMTSDAEMAGSPGENDVGTAVAAGVHLGWPIIAARVRAIPEYSQMFRDAFDEVDAADDITIVQVVNAIAAFIGTEWQSYDTPYDRWAREGVPLPDKAERGRRLFFGEAGCAQCHNGPLFSDQQFHAAGLPAFGPGRNRKFDPINRDVGRMVKTDRLDDAYRFRTPSLRNVAVTAPYGHNGAYPTLRDMIRHMADPVGSRMLWQREMARLPAVPWLAATDFVVQEDRLEMARQAQTIEIVPVRLSNEAIGEIEAFLETLTDPTPFDRPLGVPESVPSGLPVD